MKSIIGINWYTAEWLGELLKMAMLWGFFFCHVNDFFFLKGQVTGLWVTCALWLSVPQILIRNNVLTLVWLHLQTCFHLMWKIENTLPGLFLKVYLTNFICVFGLIFDAFLCCFCCWLVWLGQLYIFPCQGINHWLENQDFFIVAVRPSMWMIFYLFSCKQLIL